MRELRENYGSDTPFPCGGCEVWDGCREACEDYCPYPKDQAPTIDGYAIVVLKPEGVFHVEEVFRE